MAKKIQVPGSCIVVKWGDAFIDTDDFDPKKVQDTEPVWRYTCGFLVAKNQHGYVLCTDLYEKTTDGAAARMFIPHGMVVGVKKLSHV
jgi:hypothetical protein